MYFREALKAVRKIWPQQIVNATASTPTVIATDGAEAVRVLCTTGGFQLSTLSTAPASTDGWMLNEGEFLDVRTGDGASPPNFYVALVAATTTAAFQMVAWKD